jgi:hypothetical protein
MSLTEPTLTNESLQAMGKQSASRAHTHTVSFRAERGICFSPNARNDRASESPASTLSSLTQRGTCFSFATRLLPLATSSPDHATRLNNRMSA